MKAIFSYIGAMLMLLTSLSINLDFHLCQGKVKSLGIYAEANSCPMAMSESACSRSGREGWNRTNCCEDLNLVYYSGAFDHNSNLQSPQDAKCVPITFYRTNYAIKGAHVPVKKYIDYPPPDPVSVDLHILLETYLI